MSNAEGRFQIADERFEIADFRLQISDRKSPDYSGLDNLKSQILNLKLP
jgi:hypothetical protein